MWHDIGGVSLPPLLWGGFFSRVLIPIVIISVIAADSNQVFNGNLIGQLFRQTADEIEHVIRREDVRRLGCNSISDIGAGIKV